jgi:dUTP pyrophosphatase
MLKSFFQARPHLGVSLIDSRGKIPNYAHPDDSGLDVYPLECFWILPGERKLIKLGLSLRIPSGYEIQIRPRSGLALKEGITVLNSPATIDRGYTGEVGVILINHSTKMFKGHPSQAIAQLVLAPVAIAQLVLAPAAIALEEKSVVENDHLRGEGGYGSSDRS